MKPISEFTPEAAQKVTHVLSDLDDTLTTAGKLPAETYSALWALEKAGIKIVVVSGRPAGWCDHIARMWPVAGVVGENGAFTFYLEEGGMKRLVHENAILSSESPALERVKREVLQKFPRAQVASDQFSRQYDLAIDFAEEVSGLTLKDAQAIQFIYEKHGASAKVSSIHVNGWMGHYSKREMAERFLREVCGVQDSRSCCIFVGDSPNDEPMFQAFPLSVGVQNIEPFLEGLENPPQFVTRHAGGAGFVELAKCLLKFRCMC